MFERLTDKAVKVIIVAQEETRRLGHTLVGTEQILLGLIGEGTSVASKILVERGANLQKARKEVEKIIGRGSRFVPEQIPVTPKVKRIFDQALIESQQLG